MVKIPVFDVEQWMDAHENTPGVLNISETCASSISLSQLADLRHADGDGDRASGSAAQQRSILDFSRPMTYGAIRGSEELRRNIAALYSSDLSDGSTGTGVDDGDRVAPDDVLVTQGAIAANHLVFYALVGPGDHVVCVYPTYQQLYAVPATLGAEVSLWRLRAEDRYMPDVAALEGLIKNNTKMIVINNPNNPTGATIPKATLKSIIAIARKHNIIILSDEVYRPLFHNLPPSEAAPPSILSLGYAKAIATSSMSKAWALAGIRVGWAASRDKEIITRLASARDYTTISVSQLDDQVARHALSDSVRPALLERNVGLARTNLALLEAFVREHADVCEWVKPTAGTTAFIRFVRRDGRPVDDEAFCGDVLDTTKVMVVPGALCFGHREDFQGFVRVGYAGSTEVLKEALDKLGAYIAANLS
ncbi:PLP-dependent transferase [Nemania sp. FL0031]|nr:PLP-dependent transferase [Nemania sp. FL0031]